MQSCAVAHLTYRKIVRQQNWGEVVVLTPANLQYISEFNMEKLWNVV